MKRFHFIFGLREQHEPFHLLHYLCLASCIAVNRPDEVNFHYRHLPHGQWWDRIAPQLRLRPVEAADGMGFTSAHYANTAEGQSIARQGISFAHEADFIRLAVLAREGGVYADMDTLFVAPYHDDLYTQSCVLGEEDVYAGNSGVLRPSLCNAVIFAQPEAPFITRWQSLALQEFDGSWSRHSCQAASHLWQQQPTQLTVAPRRWFYHFGVSPAGLRSLFEEVATDLRQVYSIHLWAHLWWSSERTDFTRFHAGLLTEAYVRSGASTYAQLAQRHL